MITEDRTTVDEISLDTGLEYGSGDPVRVTVRRRDRRYDLHDDGTAVTLAGRRAGWREVMEREVERTGMNVNRRGVVFVPAVEGRDIDALARRLAETSRACYLALLELGE
jgi:hypothetical protein